MWDFLPSPCHGRMLEEHAMVWIDGGSCLAAIARPRLEPIVFLERIEEPCCWLMRGGDVEEDCYSGGDVAGLASQEESRPFLN